MYNDFLMTHKFHTEEGIAAAIQYFELNIQFLAKIHTIAILRQISDHMYIILIPLIFRKISYLSK